ncbi:MAG TPA: prepilin-type N-terminal cleavage/methylation domain-containing protein [Blastocatellia bacterium]|nr:prepilin-type N-terminal cleavage/methylation domain-containing protein [Blastocatellia bacterium]
MRKEERNYSQPAAGESGFTLIEVMIAAVVITVGLVAIVGIAAYVSRANYTSNHLNVLAVVAQDQVDRLRTAVWTIRSDSDPRLAPGGSIPGVSPTPSPSSASASESASPMSATPTTSSASSTAIYTYTLDPNNPHHATVTNTPAGDMDVYWVVRQGATPDIRYVTIKVVQRQAPAHLRDGFMVTTIINRN